MSVPAGLRRRAAVVCSALLAVPAVQASAPDVPGAGSISGGAATYSIPILDGRDGRPWVSLSYSSRSGVGDAGMGWSLAAGSSIHRCPPTVTQDGYEGYVRYESVDRLCMDGTRLVVLSGEYGRDASLYGTEIDSGSVVALSRDMGARDSTFTSVRSDGTRLTYDVPIIAGGRKSPLYWMLGRKQFSDGRRIDFRYLELAPGEVKLSEIRYGVSQADGMQSSVRFEYIDRPEPRSSFLSGGEMRATKLLRRIAIGEANHEAVSYELDYRPSIATGRPLLQRVTACAGEGASRQCGAPTTIEWIDHALAFQAPHHAGLPDDFVARAPAWRGDGTAGRVTVFEPASDFDADGRKDALSRRADGKAHVIRFDLEGNALAPTAVPSGLEFPGRNWTEVVGQDFRHLGAGELIGALDGQVAVSDWRRGSLAAPVKLAARHPGLIAATDFSGDGRPDIIAVVVRGDVLELVGYTNMSPSAAQLEFSDATSLAKMPVAADLSLEEGSWLGSGRQLVVRSGAKIHRLVEFASRPDLSVRAVVRTPADAGIDPAVLAGTHYAVDVDGGGTSSLVYVATDGEWKIQVNRDGRFAPPVGTGLRDVRSVTGRAGTIVADIDSDGADEVVFPDKRVVEFCVERSAGDALCGDALARKAPALDFGIYEYAMVEFRMRADGSYGATTRQIPGLVAQANRMRADDIDGDGYDDILSPFDGGFANGKFRAANGQLVECPDPYACGLHVGMPAQAKRKDRRDASLEFVSRVQRSSDESYEWHYYTLANPERKLYRVPALESNERYVDASRYYFTSSMWVVGEFTQTGSDPSRLRLQYGGGTYHTQGRGFDGFQWLVEENLGDDIKFTSFFEQAWPFRGDLERFWTEKLSDHEQDPEHGWPGNYYIDYQRYELTCSGPRGHPIARRFGCTPSQYPLFATASKLKGE